MIEIRNVSKSFGDIKAVNSVSLDIKEGSIFGLVGTNGAGKSTLFRMLTGILKEDEGEIAIDDQYVYDNPVAKAKVFFIGEDLYFFANATPQDMGTYYSGIYSRFNMVEYNKWLDNFSLDRKRKIGTFSKGMKRQIALLCGLFSGTKYLVCDETFDGLDPAMRQGVKSLLAAGMSDRSMTPIIASHNLRELEDICDHVGLLHKGGVLLSRDLEDMKCNIQKVQCVFSSSEAKDKALAHLDIVKIEERGALSTLLVRSDKARIIDRFATVDTVFFEVLPLSLEEIFISETEVAGYDIKKLVME